MRSNRTQRGKQIHGGEFRQMTRILPVNTGEQEHQAHGSYREGQHRKEPRRKRRAGRECCEGGGSERSHECQLNANLNVKDLLAIGHPLTPTARPGRFFQS
jgi:hypothetical protein